MTETPDRPEDSETILRRCQGRLKAFIRKRVFGREDAEDIFQTVACQFVRVNTLLDPVESANAWLYRSARNAITDLARKKKDIPFSSLFNDDEDNPEYEAMCEVLLSTSRTPEDEHLRTLILEEIEAALEDLPERQRDIYVKTEIDGLSFREVAEAEGENINTLLSRKHKAVLALRDRLRDLYDDLTA